MWITDVLLLQAGAAAAPVGAAGGAVQVGTDTIVFYDNAGGNGADGAIALAGKSLTDIDFGNFV